MYFRQRLWRMSILSFQNTTFKRSSYCLKRLFHIISFVDQKDIRPLIHSADYVYTGKRYITEKSYVTFACNYFAYSKFAGFEFQRGSCKAIQFVGTTSLYFKSTVLFTSNWLCIYSIMLSLVYGEIQEYMYTTLCVRKILWHSIQGFPVTLEHMFQYNVGLEATFWTSSQCDGDRGMLRHTHVCVIVLLWIKWPNVIGNEYASHDCYHLTFFKQLNVLPYWNIEES